MIEFAGAPDAGPAGAGTSPARAGLVLGSLIIVAAVANLRPDLYRGMIAWVPFVDVVTTMMDDTLPLVTNEYDEWGNPEQKEYYDYMLSYSPYDNVKPQRYPHLLVTAGLNDPRVQYWEPAKWVAKLRATRTDDHLLLLKTNMGAGHQGASGRYDFLRERALEYAFVLDRVGLLAPLPQEAGRLDARPAAP